MVVSNQVKFAAVGDIVLNGEIEKIVSKKGVNYPLQYVKNILRKNDIVFANLECVISNGGVRTENKPRGYPTFKASERMVCVLSDAGINVVNLANNHIYDYGEEGFYNTIRLLKKNKINFFGARKDQKEANRPLVLNKKNVKICFVGYSLHHGRESDFPNVVKPKKNEISYDLRNAKKNCDIMVVSLHQGVDFYHYPTSRTIDLCHKMIDEGADLVLGHHPHVIQGIEHYKNGIILYSLGNFLSYHTFLPFKQRLYDNSMLKDCYFERLHIEDTRMNETILFSCNITKSGLKKIAHVPIFINSNLQPIPATGKRKKIITSKIEEYSQDLSNKKNEMVRNIDNFILEKNAKKILKNNKSLPWKINKIRMHHFSVIFKVLIYLMRDFLKLKQ